MKANHLFIRSGKVWAPTLEMPDRPHEASKQDWDLYHDAREHFLASGVELENQLPNHGDRILLSSGNSISRFGNELWETYKHIYSGQWVTEAPIKENHPYEVDEFEFEIEERMTGMVKINQATSGNVPYKVAVIVEPVKEESQEALWMMVAEKLFGDKGRHKPLKETIEDLKSVFTITDTRNEQD